MGVLKNIGVVLGLIAAINGVLIIVFDHTTPVGRFYERVWYQWIQGLNARPNAYDPFAGGPAIVIFREDDLSNLDRDFAAIQNAAVGRVFTASSLNSPNSQVPQGVIAFSDTLPDAEYRGELMQEAATNARPASSITPGDEVLLVSGGGTNFHPVQSLEMFCTFYRTFEPEELCFPER